MRILTLVATALAVATLASAGPTPTQKCTSSKTKAAGKDAQSWLICASKGAKTGVGPDAACLQKATETLGKKFVSAETKGGCIKLGDAEVVDELVDSASGAIVEVLEPGTTDLSHKCAAARQLAAGKLAGALLNCEGKAALLGTAVDPLCQQKATTKFEDKFAKAAAKGGCATTGDASGVEAQVTAMVNDVVAEITAPPTTTTTSSTTTTTMFGGPVHFAADVQPIFDNYCTGCHNGAFPSAGLKLVSGQSYAALVNVASTECGAYKQVEPGNSAASYLMFKLNGSGPCFFGSKMPVGGSVTPLEAAKIAAWIDLGAAND